MTKSFCAILAVAVSLGLGLGHPASAQQVTEEIDCEDETNQDDPTCLGLPDGGAEITNFVPLIAPLVGVAALAGLGGSGGTSGTTSTTSTTSPP